MFVSWLLILNIFNSDTDVYFLGCLVLDLFLVDRFFFGK
ncbi:hypothetical protein D934_03650 [Xylella fastidiosa subsp. sandyi Ann-1]|uniref:Uncharacterized protein n=1 Tax=Xylella fastidiosa subsp. sandyi Ann-1 TaxID=155920 RepID=A0A060HCE3_XYLFS|nr:hypothetical protein D934_03650 [Xylella fastidiosa subsp. sandyi Ann-1]KAF0572190.1 hypothetical protein P305_00895 [Xylella fastidiosa subsp. fastidiosa Mus-1]